MHRSAPVPYLGPSRAPRGVTRHAWVYPAVIRRTLTYKAWVESTDLDRRGRSAHHNHTCNHGVSCW